MASENILGRIQYMKGQLPYLYDEKRMLEEQHAVLKKELASVQMKDKEHAKTKNYNSNPYKWAVVIDELEQKDLEIADRVGQIDQEIAKAEATIMGSNVSYNASQLYKYKNKKPASLSVKNVAPSLAPVSSLAASSSSSYAPMAIDPGAISSISGLALGPRLSSSSSASSNSSRNSSNSENDPEWQEKRKKYGIRSFRNKPWSSGPPLSATSTLATVYETNSNFSGNNNTKSGGTRRRINIRGTRRRRRSNN